MLTRRYTLLSEMLGHSIGFSTWDPPEIPKVEKEQLIGDCASDYIHDGKREILQILCNPSYHSTQKLKQLLDAEKEEEYNDSLTLGQKIRRYFMKFIGLFSVWRPECAFKVCWDLLGMVFILVQMLQVPLILSFQLEPTYQVQVFDAIMTYFFLCDILINCNTGFYVKFRIEFVSNRSTIFKVYSKFWLWVDIVSSLPYEDIISTAQGGGGGNLENAQLIRFIRFLKFLRIIRLLRALKLRKIIQNLQETVDIGNTIENFLNLMKLVMLILCLAHWLACLAYVIATNEPSIQHTWIGKYQIAEASWDVKYITALYWCTTTMVTIGYGDIKAVTDLERIFIVFSMVLASGVFGYATNSIILIFESRSPEQMQLDNKISIIKKYIKRKNLSSDLQDRINNYMEWLAEEEYKARIQNYTLDTISMGLKDELETLLKFRVINEVAILKDTFTSSLVAKIAFKMKEKVFSPDDKIIEFGKPNDHVLYFIKKGEVSLVVTESIPHQILGKGTTFGQIGFFTDLERTAEVTAIDFAYLVSLSREDFLKVCNQSDFFQFHQMKHDIQWKREYNKLRLTCFICEGQGHVAIWCRKRTFIPKYHIKIAPSIDQMRKSMKRSARKHNLSLKHNLSKEVKNYNFFIQKKVTFYEIPQIQPRNEKPLDGFELGINYDKFCPEANLDQAIETFNKLQGEALKNFWEERKKTFKSSKILSKLNKFKSKAVKHQSQLHHKPQRLLQVKEKRSLQQLGLLKRSSILHNVGSSQDVGRFLAQPSTTRQRIDR